MWCTVRNPARKRGVFFEAIHPGGRTALSLLGKAHYLELVAKRVIVFGGKGEKLPAWFKKHDWGVAVNYYQTSFMPSDGTQQSCRFQQTVLTLKWKSTWLIAAQKAFCFACCVATVRSTKSFHQIFRTSVQLWTISFPAWATKRLGRKNTKT